MVKAKVNEDYRPVLGNLTHEQAQTYQNLIEDGRLECEPGGNADVYFCGNTAIKTSRENDWQSKAKIIWGEAVARYLRSEGVQAVNSQGSYFDENGAIAVMDSRNWEDYDNLSLKEKASAKKQYKEQVAKIRALGFDPGDVSLEHNTSFHRKSGKLEFFDFDEYVWRKN